jgi:hypothetical protein
LKKNEFVKAVIAGVLLGILLKIGMAESWFHIRESAWSQSLLFTAVYAVLLLIVFRKSFPLAIQSRKPKEWIASGSGNAEKKLFSAAAHPDFTLISESADGRTYMNDAGIFLMTHFATPDTRARKPESLPLAIMLLSLCLLCGVLFAMVNTMLPGMWSYFRTHALSQLKQAGVSCGFLIDQLVDGLVLLAGRMYTLLLRLNDAILHLLKHS